jgi:hypothetical protein
MLVTKCVRDVQELKTHASESGQMHAQHLAICGQVIKKKMHRVSAQNESAGNGPRWCLKDTPSAAFFLLQRYRSARQSPVQNGVFRTRKAAATFLYFMHQYSRSFLFSTGFLFRD